MPENPERETEKKYNSTRRKFLGAAAGSAVLSSSAIGTVVAKSGPKIDISDFEVTGKKRTTIDINPSEVTVTTKKSSPELKKRYGKMSIKNEEVKDRTHPEEDDLPRTDTIVKDEHWKGTVAKEDEWVELVQSDNADQLHFSMSSEGEIGKAAEYPEVHPKYYHNNEDNMFVLSGPINMVGSVQYSDASECANNIASNGTGSYTWTTSVIDATRYALTGFQYQAHEASVASGPFGITGRTHARLWNSDDQVLIASHEDSWVPHSAIAYDDAEVRIDGFMDSSTNRYNVGNDEKPSGGQLLDHDGEATLIFDT